jgi:rare lipoprotein A
MTTFMENKMRQTFTRLQISFSTPLRILFASMVCMGLASCGTTSSVKQTSSKRSKEFFAESKYGVKASPRVAKAGKVPKGGGRYMVGKPYKVAGKWYYPKEDRSYDKVGLASWYGSAFHGRKTANGEVYDQYTISAAHPTFPLPSYARVTNLENGSSVIVRVNDRGPFDRNRVIDLSNKSAELLDIKQKGTAKVRVQYVGPARMDGHDMPYLMASYAPKGSRIPAFNPGNAIATGVMVASNDKSFTPKAIAEQPVAANRDIVTVPTYQPTEKIAAKPVSQGIDPVALAPEPQQTAAFDAALQPFPVLPEFGPMPPERPASLQLASSANTALITAFLPENAKRASSPFDGVLNHSRILTPEIIQTSFYNRRDIK